MMTVVLCVCVADKQKVMTCTKSSICKSCCHPFKSCSILQEIHMLGALQLAQMSLTKY